MGGFNFSNIGKAVANKNKGTASTTGTTAGTTKAPTTVSGTVVSSGSPTQVTGTVVSSAPKVGVAAPNRSVSSTSSRPSFSDLATPFTATQFKPPPNTKPGETPKATAYPLLNPSIAGFKLPPTGSSDWARSDIPEMQEYSSTTNGQSKTPVDVKGTVVTPKDPVTVTGTVVSSNNKSSAPPTFTGSTIGNTPLITGAINYATADKAGRQQIVANQAKIKSDPSYVNSEINRTLQVIKDRQAQGLDTSAQTKYLYSNLGYQDASNSNTQTTEQANQYALTDEQLEAMARAELEAQLAELQANAAQQKAALQAQYDYANQVTQENRTLENLQFDRVNAPTSWDGSTGYRGAMLDRNRSLQDTQTQLQLQSSLAAADQEVADFQNQMSSLIASRTGELKQQERAYDLDYAGVYGTGLSGQQTLQSQEADRTYGLNYANTYGVGQNGQQTAAYQNQLFNQNMQTNDMLGTYLPTGARDAISQIISLKQQAETKGITAQQKSSLSQQSDALRSQLTSMGINPNLFGSGVSAAQAIKNLQSISSPTQSAYQYENNLAYQQSRDQVSDAQWDISFQYQKVRDAISDTKWQSEFDQNVLQFGMNYALQKLSEENQAAYQNAMLAINKDENARAWLTYGDSFNDTSSPTYSGITANQAYDSLYTQFVNKETGKIPSDTTTKNTIYQQVMSLGLPDGQDTQVMTMLGLTQADITKYDKQYGVDSGNSNSATAFKAPSSGAYTNYYKAAQDSKANPKNYATASSAVSKAIKTLGLSSDWLSPTLELVARESSFNPNAKNSTSSAAGLFQFLNDTRKAYGGSSVDWSDPYQQALAGLKYIKDRYGTPVKALQHWDEKNWY